MRIGDEGRRHPGSGSARARRAGQHPVVVDAAKGDHLLHQRGHEMEQHFTDGIPEALSPTPTAREAGLGFAGQGDFESSTRRGA